MSDAAFSGCEKLVELFETLEANGESAEVHFRSDLGTGSVWFRSGRLVDAQLGSTVARAALFRLLNARTVSFEMERKAVDREPKISDSIAEVLLARSRRAEQWRSLLTRVPALDTVAAIDHDVLSRLRAELSEPEFELLVYVDRRRTLLEVIDDSGLDALGVLERIAAYLEMGLLVLLQRSPSHFPKDGP
ncbi:MAG TPA: DUF4388 domain-containing protein, partial [Polyangiaceae bacterium]|nr:DUF4388 domain-containing protein [Polyangiaceae bacterium]